jgi:hypothetical protein
MCKVLAEDRSHFISKLNKLNSSYFYHSKFLFKKDFLVTILVAFNVKVPYVKSINTICN